MPETEFPGAIVYCPVCCTNQDALSWGENSLECGNCDTTFTVLLEEPKYAAHSQV